MLLCHSKLRWLLFCFCPQAIQTRTKDCWSPPNPFFHDKITLLLELNAYGGCLGKIDTFRMLESSFTCSQHVQSSETVRHVPCWCFSLPSFWKSWVVSRPGQSLQRVTEIGGSDLARRILRALGWLTNIVVQYALQTPFQITKPLVYAPCTFRTLECCTAHPWPDCEDQLVYMPQLPFKRMSM